MHVSKYARSVSDHSGFLNAQLEACLANLKLVSLKTIYLFGCLRGSLVVKKVLGGFSVSSESVSYPYRSGRKFEDMKQPCFHEKIIGDVIGDRKF